MARKQGSGFKMKRGPMKDLGSFFSSFGKQLKRGQAERGIFSEKGKAEKKEMRKTGESKFQFDVRKRKEAKREAKKAIEAKSKYETPDLGAEIKGDFSTAKTYTGGFGPDHSKIVHPSMETKKEKSKPDWSKAPKVGTQARTNWYKKHNLALDDTTPGYTPDPIKVEPGSFVDIDGNGIDDRVEGVTRYHGNPINKKSPHKKSGFKMKSSPVKIYNKAGKRRKNYKY